MSPNEDTNNFFGAQEILTRVQNGDVPSIWRVFRISRKKLCTLIVSFCIITNLLLGLLMIYILGLGNFVHHPPVPSNELYVFTVIILVFISFIIFLAIFIWLNMKNTVLVLTPEGFVRGDSKKPKRILYIHYREVAAMYIDGSTVVVQPRGNTWRKKLIDCRLFESSTREVAFHLCTAYETFKAEHTSQKKKKKK